MRRIFFTIVCFCLAQNASFASSNITLMYLHGSNSNTYEERQWFEKRVHKLHPVLKREIERKVKGEKINPDISDYSIGKQPEFFFWGFSSKAALESMKSRLDMTKSVSAPVAFWARRFLSHELHDAVWIVKMKHYMPILEQLNKQVLQECNKGNKIILAGYSMGTFITYKYLLFKLRYLNPGQIPEYLKIDDKEISDFIDKHPQKNTCLSAITDGGIGKINLDGKISPNENQDELKQNYLNLEQLSNKHCAPENIVLGVINYGSPLAVFSSELEDKDDELVKYTERLAESILDRGLFFITINFVEDPLGFPLMSTDVKLLKNSGEGSDSGSRGLIYDNYSVKSWRWFIFAHQSYFSARKIFPKEVVKSLNSKR